MSKGQITNCAQLYLQTGTTIGLSLISLNWPLSLRACSTAFLASKRFVPWGTDRIAESEKLRNETATTNYEAS